MSPAEAWEARQTQRAAARRAACASVRASAAREQHKTGTGERQGRARGGGRRCAGRQERRQYSTDPGGAAAGGSACSTVQRAQQRARAHLFGLPLWQDKRFGRLGLLRRLGYPRNLRAGRPRRLFGARDGGRAQKRRGGTRRQVSRWVTVLGVKQERGAQPLSVRRVAGRRAVVCGGGCRCRGSSGSGGAKGATNSRQLRINALQQQLKALEEGDDEEDEESFGMAPIAAGSDREARDRCYKCGAQGHATPDCRSKKELRSCFHCRQAGHLRAKCPELHKGAQKQGKGQAQGKGAGEAGGAAPGAAGSKQPTPKNE